MRNTILLLWLMAGLALCVLVSQPPAARHVSAIDVGKQHLRSFIVGGNYTAPEGSQVNAGQMYVRAMEHPRRGQYPSIIMVHGVDQTGAGFVTTPDGRQGWAPMFFAGGFNVYVVDQVGRGMSGASPELYGPYARRLGGVITLQMFFTAPENFSAYPQAHLHTQWPDGMGVPGQPSFDRFAASQVDSLTDDLASERLMAPALISLLQLTGPAIILTHSQAGTYGWKTANDRPDLVRALISIEPNGPPFYDINVSKLSEGNGEATPDRAWGLTRLPLSFEPITVTAAELKPVKEFKSDTGALRCWLQQTPARSLPRLASVPIMIVTGEASFHALYDQCTAQFLEQAGVRVTHLELSNMGIHGNGHMMMLEANNTVIAKIIMSWLHQNTAVGL